MNRLYLPEGYHRNLHIKVQTSGTGPFSGGGYKLIWHTTEGNGFETMARVLRDKGAEPHVLIEPNTGYVLQMVRFDQYAKALKHPTGTPETNRAHCIQVEICGFSRESPNWGEHVYRNLARLALLIEHRVPVPRRASVAFRVGAPRLSPSGFIRASGHFGHEHVPNNDHWDPGAMRIKHLLNLIKEV